VKSYGSWMPSGRRVHSGEIRNAPGGSLVVQRMVRRPEVAWDLDSLVLIQIKDEDRGRSRWRKTRRRIGRQTGGMSVGTNQIEYTVDLIFIGADKQRGVAAPEQATGAGQASRPKVAFKQGVDHMVGVIILDNRNHEFLHGRPLPFSHRCMRPGEYTERDWHRPQRRTEIESR